MADFVIGSRGRKVKFTRVSPGTPIAEKLIAYSEDGEGGCRVWTRGKYYQGYGVCRHDGKYRKAHRVSYEVFVGPIPDGLEMDHLCRNRACINPAHLEPVTHLENMRRSNPWHPQKAKRFCPSGHPYDERNTLISKATGERRCRACMRAYKQRAKERKRASQWQEAGSG